MKQCSQCQSKITCTNQPTHCWCFQLPVVSPVGNPASCLCKPCLIKRINGELKKLYDTEALSAQIAKASQYQNQMPVKDLDFYLNEEGHRVMTRWAHLKRGYCCGNGCKHCPY